MNVLGIVTSNYGYKNTQYDTFKVDLYVLVNLTVNKRIGTFKLLKWSIGFVIKLENNLSLFVPKLSNKISILCMLKIIFVATDAFLWSIYFEHIEYVDNFFNEWWLSIENVWKSTLLALFLVLFQFHLTKSLL